jgi:hypothetical protein
MKDRACWAGDWSDRCLVVDEVSRLPYIVVMPGLEWREVEWRYAPSESDQLAKTAHVSRVFNVHQTHTSYCSDGPRLNVAVVLFPYQRGEVVHCSPEVKPLWSRH